LGEYSSSDAPISLGDAQLGRFSENRRTTMKMKSKVKAGALGNNHNLRIKTRVKAGALGNNHNLTLR
jgi:hypothetical protein